MALLHIEKMPRLHVARKMYLFVIAPIAVIVYMAILLLILVLIIPFGFFQKPLSEAEDDRYLDW